MNVNFSVLQILCIMKQNYSFVFQDNIDRIFYKN